MECSAPCNACDCNTTTGLTAWAANARSVNSYYESASEPYQNTSVPSLQAQQQLLLMQYDIWASVYQFTQVTPVCIVLLAASATLSAETDH